MKEHFREFINEAKDGKKFTNILDALKLLESSKFGDNRDRQIDDAIKKLKAEIDSRKANSETNL